MSMETYLWMLVILGVLKLILDAIVLSRMSAVHNEALGINKKHLALHETSVSRIRINETTEDKLKSAYGRGYQDCREDFLAKRRIAARKAVAKTEMNPEGQ